MITNKTNKPDLIQAFDIYKDRIFYKIDTGFLFTSNIVVRADRLEEWKEWSIRCNTLPDKIIINGELYQLNKMKEYERHN